MRDYRDRNEGSSGNDDGVNLRLRDVLDPKVYDILIKSLTDGPLVRQARRYYAEREMDKVTRDEAYQHLKRLTPDGMRPNGVHINLAHNIAHVLRVRFIQNRKNEKLFGGVLEEIARDLENIDNTDL